MESRRRKPKTRDDSADLVPKPKTTKPAKSSRRRYFLFVSLFLLLSLCYLFISYDLKPLGTKAIDSLAVSFSFQKPFYVVVLDCGSTGSRALAFKFYEGVISGNLVLTEELYTETKPGLSSFADRPQDGARSLTVLLDKAKKFIPKTEWSKTPLTMRATAGLRLLPEKKSTAILAECRKLFQDSGFQLQKNSVSILEGADEGIFSWFTVNFLLDRFSIHDPAGTVAALDLGGGSTQVTFSPTEQPIGRHIYSLNIFDRNMSVYTHSYLGMGLMAARKHILSAGQVDKTVSPILIRSECINPNVSTEWSYGGKTYEVRGPVNGTHKRVKAQNFAGGEEDRPVVMFADCAAVVQKYVAGIKEKPRGLKDHEIYAFSYYFDRATEVGLVDPFLGGVVSVSAFLRQAMEACDYPNSEQPFICLDLTFIYILLRDGFGLEPSTKLYLFKKIEGHELSWALGAAFNVLQNGL